MSSGLFRGKDCLEVKNLQTELKYLLNFGVLGSLWLWGGGRWVGCLEASGGMGYPYTCVHACVFTHAHVYMYRNCKWLPTWRHPCLSCLTCMWVCGFMCTFMYVYGAWGPSHMPTPTQSTHPSPFQGGDPRNQLKFNNT